jgi:transposase
MPEQPTRVAHAAFPKGQPSLPRRDPLGTMFQDDDVAARWPTGGSPGLPPWRLAWVTLLPCRANLADRHAAEAVRARRDGQALRGLECSDPGCDLSVLSAWRDRCLAGGADDLFLATLRERGRARGWLQTRGQPRTDATQVRAAMRVLTRLERVAATRRAALQAVATIAPTWLQGAAPLAWEERSGKRLEATRLPRAPAQREASVQTVGEEGEAVLDALDASAAPEGLRTLPRLDPLRRGWHHHDARLTDPTTSAGHPAASRVRCKTTQAWPRAAEALPSPSDPDARYRHKRETSWVGSMGQGSATWEPTAPHLRTQGHTTTAAVHAARWTADSPQALGDQDLAPGEPWGAAASSDADLLVRRQADHGLTRRGPARPHPPGHAQVAGASTVTDFPGDGEHPPGEGPQGQAAARWPERLDHPGIACMQGRFAQHDCGACPARPFGTQATQAARSLTLQPQAPWEARHATRAWDAREEGQQRAQRRAGLEGTLSQGVRRCGRRGARSRGLAKTHVPHVAPAAAIPSDRLVAGLDERPRAQTRLARFAARAPPGARKPGAGAACSPPEVLAPPPQSTPCCMASLVPIVDYNNNDCLT